MSVAHHCYTNAAVLFLLLHVVDFISTQDGKKHKIVVSKLKIEHTRWTMTVSCLFGVMVRLSKDTCPVNNFLFFCSENSFFFSLSRAQLKVQLGRSVTADVQLKMY